MGDKLQLAQNGLGLANDVIPQHTTVAPVTNVAFVAINHENRTMSIFPPDNPL
jgi:hypothetical protein